MILVHGAGSGRDSVRELAALLHTQGYGVRALNLRGYGDSSGSINRLGWASRPDIGAAIEFLKSSPGVEHIGAMGLSMGGELLLGAASTYPEISAVVTEGATFRSVNDYVALPANQPLVRNFTQHVFSFVVQLLSGTPPPTPTLIDSIQAAERTHFLLIAAGTLQTEIEYNQLYQQTAADRSELWIIADAGHTGGYALDPAAYEARVIGFFDQTLSPQPLAPFP
ncbi:MAG: alpha/beta fold hydrolase [Anaerolineae bacterium]